MRKILLITCQLTLAMTIGQAANSQQVRNEQDGSVQHIDSGWVFQKSIEGFDREAAEAKFPGPNIDAYARYKAQLGTSTIDATVYVYLPTSEAADATLAAARHAIENNPEAMPTDFFAEGAIRVEGNLPLLGNKAIYKYGFGKDSSLNYLYFFDTGSWIVKIRVSASNLQKETFQQIDNFVRKQAWTSLQLSNETCTGSACGLNRALPIHGPMEEMIAILSVKSGITKLFPKTKLQCSSANIASLLASDSSPPPGEKEKWIERVTTCHLDQAILSVIRLYPPPTAIETIEQQSPEGMTLRGPLTFFAYSDGKRTHLTQLHDGTMMDIDAAEVLRTIKANRKLDFAVGDKEGRNTMPQLRLQP